MTGRAWVLNLDADLELARGSGYSPSPAILEQLRPHARALAATLPPGDVWIDGENGFAGRPGACWCPTPSALQRLAEAGAIPPSDAPSFAILRRVNGRSFSHRLRSLAGERRLDDLVAARRALERGRWIVHREHTFAGRGHRFVDGPASERDLAWIAKGLTLGPVFASPRLRIELEVALHGKLEGASVARGEVTVQHVSGVQWRRSVRAPDVLEPSERRLLHETFDQVVEALRAEGYRGPFGIDAFRHPSGFHPLSEINARYSMGYPIGMGGW